VRCSCHSCGFHCPACYPVSALATIPVLNGAVQVARAKQEAASILTEARAQILAQARRPSSASEGGAAGIVEASMRSLNLSDAAEVPLPGTIARRWVWRSRGHALHVLPALQSSLCKAAGM
jgi:hypothetical protein